MPDRDSIAALYLARREGKSWVYAGKVGTGFTRKSAHVLRQLFDVIATDDALIALPMRKPKAAVWVRPEYEAEVEYRGLSSDGLLRAASFKHLHGVV